VWGVPMDESHSPSRKSPDVDRRSRWRWNSCRRLNNPR
jgi:hypothetical protein